MSENVLLPDTNEGLDALFSQETGGRPSSLLSTPTEEAQPEQAQEAPPAQEERKPKLVPHAALHESREENKQLKARLAEQEDRIRRMDEAFQRAMQAPQPAQHQTEIDPEKAVLAEYEELKRSVAALQQHTGHTLQYQQQVQQVQQFVGRYQESIRQYAESDPSFVAGYQHLMQSRGEELAALGYSLPEIQQIVQQDELSIARKAYEDGVSPGERLLALARLRGFNGGEQAAARPAGTAQQNSQLQRVADGMKASVPTSASTEYEGGLSLDKIADLPDAEFDKAIAKLRGKDRGLFG